MAKDAMNNDQIKAVVEVLRETEDYDVLPKRFPNYEPTFWKVNKESFLRMAGLEVPKDDKAKK